MTDPRPPINPALVLAHARAWVGTPHHRGQALRGRGCDCVGLIRGVFRELTGKDVPPPGWRDDWSSVTGAIESALAARLIRVPLSDAAPGHVATFRVGPNRAAHVGIIEETGEDGFPRVIHAADYAGRVLCDRWSGFAFPTSVWALPAPVGCETGPDDLDVSDCVAVIYPCLGVAALARVYDAHGNSLARAGLYDDTAAALDALTPIYPHIETME